MTDRKPAFSRNTYLVTAGSFSVDKRERGGGFGLEGLAEHAGAFLGPVLTVLLLYSLQFDFRVIFFLAFVPALMAFSVVLFVNEKSPPTPDGRGASMNPRQLPA